jgi:hypothetical protein
MGSRCFALAIALAVCALATGAQGLELITNGTFEGGSTPAGVSDPNDLGPDTIPNSWSRYETFFGGVAENSFIGPFVPNGPSLPGLVGVEFLRSGGGQTGDWTTIEQPLNIDAADYSSLQLSMDIQVLSHDLQAGGWVTPAFEWPAMVEVQYKDISDTTQIWRYGWYLSPPGDVGGSGNSPANDPGQGLIPFYNDQVVPINTWWPNTFDLFAQLPQVKTITNIRVGGSGWNFHSFVDNVSLQGTPSGIPEPATLSLVALGALALLRRR